MHEGRPETLFRNTESLAKIELALAQLKASATT